MFAAVSVEWMEIRSVLREVLPVAFGGFVILLVLGKTKRIMASTEATDRAARVFIMLFFGVIK
jgi:hypothetical protein